MVQPSTFQHRTLLAASELVRGSTWLALGVGFSVVGAQADAVFATLVGWSLVLCLSLYVGLRVDALVAYLRRGVTTRPGGPGRWAGIVVVALVIGVNVALLVHDVNVALEAMI